MTDSADAERRFRALYDGSFAAVLGYALRRVDQPADAADVVSEVFLVAWRRYDEVPPGDARPWLFGIARHVLNNARRPPLCHAHPCPARPRRRRRGGDHRWRLAARRQRPLRHTIAGRRADQRRRHAVGECEQPDLGDVPRDGTIGSHRCRVQLTRNGQLRHVLPLLQKGVVGKHGKIGRYYLRVVTRHGHEMVVVGPGCTIRRLTSSPTRSSLTKST